ncbi:hypothetical protein NDN08_001574 [Rhodosorus marinus]|uniref:Thiamine pyrimidine synthase n=1 Tax=Rhodosorus marinus TaxID=101924 RepID=A0AAV8UVB9_9RHOD|nr:hypothetical protein NDN08_001574 [Rhodosorus marinus]
MFTRYDEKASGYVKLDSATCKYVGMGQWMYRILALLLLQIGFCNAASEPWRVEVWSSRSDQLPPVYRFGGGCRLGDGQVVLQSPSDDVKREMESAGLDKGVTFTEQLPTGLPTVKADLLHSERLGEQYPRFAEADFVKDILIGALTIGALDRPLSDENRRDYSCYGARCEEAKDEQIRVLHPITADLEKMANNGVSKTITGPILSALSDKVLLVSNRTFHEATESGVCFQSIILFNNKFPESAEDVFDSSHFLWRNLNLTRDPKEQSERFRDGTCVVNMEAVSSKRGASIANIYSLEEAIKTALGDLPIEIVFNADYYEGRSPEYQIYRANKADIFLTSLRTAEANVIFMRRNTSLIEVFPAATAQVHFVPIARILGVHFSAINGSPRPHVLRSCLEKGGNADIDKAMAWYEDFAAKMTTPDGPSARASFFSHDVGPCLNKQDIVLDLEYTPQHIVQIARSMCSLS